MSAALTFDTLKFVTRLESAGVPRQHAQAEAEALAEVLQAGSEQFATERDIEDLRRDAATMEERINVRLDAFEKKMDAKFEAVNAKIGAVDANIGSSAANVKSELIKWVVGIALAQSALLVGVLMRLPH